MSKFKLTRLAPADCPRAPADLTTEIDKMSTTDSLKDFYNPALGVPWVNNSKMTTTQHLEKIKAKCTQLLAIAEKRTPGRWEWHWRKDDDQNPGSIFALPRVGHAYAVSMCPRYGRDRFIHDAAFIASCAGPAEAGWRATIDMIEEIKGDYSVSQLSEREQLYLKIIIAAWPEELL